MDCHQIETLLVDYAGHDLTPVLRARVGAHLNHCYHCSERLAETVEMLDTARESLRHPDPALRYEALWAQIQQQRTPTLLDYRPKLTVGAALKYVSAAAAMVLLLIGAGDALNRVSIELRPAALRDVEKPNAPVTRYIAYCARVESAAETVENPVQSPPAEAVPASPSSLPANPFEPVSRRSVNRILS